MLIINAVGQLLGGGKIDVKVFGGRLVIRKIALVKEFQGFFIESIVTDAVKQGDLKPYSAEVRNSQKIKSRTIRALELKDVQANVDLDDELFDLEFPPQTTVIDFTKKDGKGKPLKYVVGGFDHEFTEEEALNAVLENEDGSLGDGNGVGILEAIGVLEDVQEPSPAAWIG